MAFIPIPRTAQFNVRYQYDGQRVENVVHFQPVNGDVTAEWLDAMAEALFLSWASGVMTRLAVGLTLTQVYAVDQSSATGPVATYVPPSPVSGGQNFAGLPGNCSLCVSLRTASRGRSYRGRLYLPGLVTATVVQGRIDTANADLIRTELAVSLLTDQTVPGISVIASRYSGGLPRAVGLATPITDVVLTDYIIDSQRRRLPGRGQ